MKKYLLDTNMIIFLLRNKHRIKEKIAFVGLDNCYVSEITLAELKIGAEKSNAPITAHNLIETFSKTISILSISDTIDLFAREKVRLERAGKPMHDNFDVLIASTALLHDLTLVTSNVKHFIVYPSLRIEDWSQPNTPF